MKKALNTFIKIVKVLIILIIVSLVLITIHKYTGFFHNILGSSEVASVSNVYFDSPKSIGQLKTLTVYKDVLIRSKINNEPHVVIYPAKLSLGFDLSQLSDESIKLIGDTVTITLPEVQILNENSSTLDELRQRNLVNRGANNIAGINNSLTARANAQIIYDSEIEDYFMKAEQEGIDFFNRFYNAMGYKVIVNTTPRPYLFNAYPKKELLDEMPYHEFVYVNDEQFRIKNDYESVIHFFVDEATIYNYVIVNHLANIFQVNSLETQSTMPYLVEIINDGKQLYFGRWTNTLDRNSDIFDRFQETIMRDEVQKQAKDNYDMLTYCLNDEIDICYVEFGRDGEILYEYSFQ